MQRMKDRVVSNMIYNNSATKSGSEGTCDASHQNILSSVSEGRSAGLGVLVHHAQSLD